MANKFIEFIIEIEEKFPEGNLTNDFDKLLLKNYESFIFIKKKVEILKIYLI